MLRRFIVRISLTLLLLVGARDLRATNLLINQISPYGDLGYGLSSWNNMSAALNSAFGAGNITVSGSPLTDLPALLSYDRLWITARQPFNQSLSATEQANLSAFIATGRRVALIGESFGWTSWDNSILAPVGGNPGGGTTSNTLTPAIVHPLTAGVGSLDTAFDGIAVGGTSVFNQNVITLWGTSQSVVSILSLNLEDDVDGASAGNLTFETNLAGWLANIPEPSSLVLAAFGVIGLVAWCRRRRKLVGETVMKRLICIVFSAALCLLLAEASAAPITVPTGLNPGDQYRLAFVTSTTRDATSSNIEDYNAFVTSAANSIPALAALGTTWKAIASTSTVDARDNTRTTPESAVELEASPIYRLDGVLLVAHAADLWTADQLYPEFVGPQAPLSVTEDGSPRDVYPNLVWTGTDYFGFAAGSEPDVANPGPLGSTTELVLLGSSMDANLQGRWIQYSNGDPVENDPAHSWPLYGMSGVLTVPVPEPSTFALAALSVVGFLAVRKRRRAACAGMLLSALALLAADARAVTIAWSPVGNAGNANDPATGKLYGGVGYNYNIGTYDVTNSQYAEFLNTKDPTGANTLGLWNSNMSSFMQGGINFNNLNLPGSKYSVKTGDGNHPVNFVTWYDTIRFANWMNNGQGSASTETGAYTLGPLGPGGVPINGDSITRNAGATVFLPSESEWYKAAYYDPRTTAQGGPPSDSHYWLYGTTSSSDPLASGPTATPNSANYHLVVGDLTDVGAYTGTTSPYGAFDMAGNVHQWNEAAPVAASRAFRGGSYGSTLGGPVELRSSNREHDALLVEYGDIGFRVASIPEPSTLVLVAVGILGLFFLRKSRRAASAGMLLVMLSIFGAPISTLAAPITVPTDLSVGDKYRLVFVTSTTRDALSSNIDDYNDFVSGVANGVPELAALGTTWKAIGSTPSIDARDNTDTNPNLSPGVPIYNLQSLRVADNNAALWGVIPFNAFTELLNPILYDEAGTPHPFPNFITAFTGTAPDGTAADTLGGFFAATYGRPDTVTASWISDTADPLEGSDHFYVISGELTVVPEPSTFVLAALGLIGVFALRKRRRAICAAIVLSTFMLLAADARAVTIQWSPVGDAGNANDPATGNLYGGVAYNYRIGTTEVTNAQYADFLNAVADTDTYGLYSTHMVADPRSGITRTGSSGSYSYSVKADAGSYKYADKPVVSVSWGDAARFANWLHNGQPIGGQGPGTTETGAYTLNGATSDASLNAVARNAGATWFIPSENEWYKAAYYNGSSYHDYPTGTDTTPDNNLPSLDSANSANFYDSGNTTGSNSYPMTDAGAYTLSASPYGTFDQGGNAVEWNEAIISGSSRGIRGGSWGSSAFSLQSADREYYNPSLDGQGLGFRVATVPEPSTFALAALGVVGFFALRLRRRFA